MVWHGLLLLFFYDHDIHVYWVLDLGVIPVCFGMVGSAIGRDMDKLFVINMQAFHSKNCANNGFTF